MTEQRHLAQLNIGRVVGDLDDPRLADFMNNLDRINGLAERMPGYVWRLTGAGSNATDVTVAPSDPRLIANLTVWEDVESLADFVWGTLHKRFYQRKAEWFEPMGQAHFVMWWIPAGHRPTIGEGQERLGRLRRDGPSDDAFGWESVTLPERSAPQPCSNLAAE